MKRILFYFVLLLQVVIIIFISGQYYLIDRFGQEIKLKVNPQDFEEDDYFEYMDEVYLEYDILEIPKRKWTGVKEPSYNEKAYVLLKQNKEGVYEIQEASTSKLQPVDGESLLLAHVEYRDEHTQVVHVTYGLEFIRKDRLPNDVNIKEPMTATWIVSPWNQKKFVQVVNNHD